MANTINWQRCYRDLEAKFPQIKARLEERVVSLLDSSLMTKTPGHKSKIREDISLDNKPPRVSLRFLCDEKIGNIDQEFKKKRIQIGEAVGKVASEFSMKAYAGYSTCYFGKRKWTNDSSGRDYELRPDYQEYKM